MIPADFVKYFALSNLIFSACASMIFALMYLVADAYSRKG